MQSTSCLLTYCIMGVLLSTEGGCSTDLSMIPLLHCSSLTKISISSFRRCILEQRKRDVISAIRQLFIMCTHTHTHTNLETIWSLSVGVIPGCCPDLVDRTLKRILSRVWGAQRWCYMITKLILSNLIKELYTLFINFWPCVTLQSLMWDAETES